VDPGAHLLIRVEFAEGLEHHSPFVAVRVAGMYGELKGVRGRGSHSVTSQLNLSRF